MGQGGFEIAALCQESILPGPNGLDIIVLVFVLSDSARACGRVR